MYQQNQRKIRFPNLMVPNDNLPCLPLTACSPGGFRNVPPSTFRQNYAPQQFASTNSNTPSMETNFMNQRFMRSTTPTIVRPTTSNNYGNGLFDTFINNWLTPSNLQTSFTISEGRFRNSTETVAQPGALMQYKSPLPYSRDGKNLINTNRSGKVETAENITAKNSNFADKKNPNEKIRILTGTAEKVINWNRVYKDYLCYYEVIASIISIQEGTVRLQKVFLLRNNKGPIIQVHHYLNDHIKIENFVVGQMLRCVGRMVGPNIMHGLSIRQATLDEVATLERMCFISDHAITKAISKS